MGSSHMIESTNVLEKLPLSVSTLCYRCLDNDLHIHKYTHIAYVLAGEATGFIDGKERSFPAGSCVIAAPFALHSFDTRNSEDTPIVVHIRFDNSFLYERGYRFFHYNQTLRFEERTLPCTVTFTDENRPEATRIIRSITSEFEKGKKMSFDLIAGYMADFFRMIAPEAQQEPLSPITTETIQCITNAVNYIEKNFHKKLTIDDMVPVTAMSRSLFTRQFKAITGMTFVQFLTSIRLSHVLPMVITEEEMSLNEIAAKTGLYNKTNLVRTFTKAFGMPPMKFREYFEKGSPGTMERHRMYQKRWKWLYEDENTDEEYEK